jgi:hypothetical protein
VFPPALNNVEVVAVMYLPANPDRKMKWLMSATPSGSEISTNWFKNS